MFKILFKEYIILYFKYILNFYNLDNSYNIFYPDNPIHWKTSQHAHKTGARTKWNFHTDHKTPYRHAAFTKYIYPSKGYRRLADAGEKIAKVKGAEQSAERRTHGKHIPNRF